MVILILHVRFRDLRVRILAVQVFLQVQGKLASPQAELFQCPVDGVFDEPRARQVVRVLREPVIPQVSDSFRYRTCLCSLRFEDVGRSSHLPSRRCRRARPSPGPSETGRSWIGALMVASCPLSPCSFLFVSMAWTMPPMRVNALSSIENSLVPEQGRAGTASRAAAGDGALGYGSAGRRSAPSLRTPGRLRMTAVDAVPSQARVCLGSGFLAANIAKTACEPRNTAPRQTLTSTPGIQSATADPMWPLTGFAIGTVVGHSEVIC